MMPEQEVVAPGLVPVQFLTALARGVIIVLAFVGAYTLWMTSRAPVQLSLEPQTAGARLAVTSATADRNQGFVTVTGDVVNHTGSKLKDVVAVVELRDKEDHTVKLESALVSSGEVEAEQPTGFRVELPDDARAVSYSVRFRNLSGAHFE
jgi:hypothetical protein